MPKKWMVILLHRKKRPYFAVIFLGTNFANDIMKEIGEWNCQERGVFVFFDVKTT